MSITKEIRENAKKINATIILPEANLDDRVAQACEIILNEKLAKIMVFGKPSEFSASIASNPNCTIIDIESYHNLHNFATQLYELRKHKGLTTEQASELVKNPAYFAMLMLKNGLADGVVAGAKFTTADTLRPALQIIKTKANKKSVVGSMIMAKENEKPLVFADVSLIEKPDSETLAEIAVSSAEFMQKV